MSDATGPRLRKRVMEALEDGPKSSDELGVQPSILLLLRDEGIVAVDPDRWPDEYVPGNPMVARLPGDERRWPGWSKWNV